MAASPAAIFCCAARLWMPSCRRTAARRRTSYMTWPACTSARALSTSTSTEAADTILWTARRRHITARARCTSATAPRPWCPLRWPPQRKSCCAPFLYLNAAGTALRTARASGPAHRGALHRQKPVRRTGPALHPRAGPRRVQRAAGRLPAHPSLDHRARAARRTGDGACAAGARRTAQHRPQ